MTVPITSPLPLRAEVTVTEFDPVSIFPVVTVSVDVVILLLNVTALREAFLLMTSVLNVVVPEMTASSGPLIVIVLPPAVNVPLFVRFPERI